MNRGKEISEASVCFSAVFLFCFFSLKRGLWLQGACLCIRHQTVVNFWAFGKKRINEKADGGKGETERNKSIKIRSDSRGIKGSLLNKIMSSFTDPHVVPNP